ncbi:MAG: hypothetical protein LRY43_02905 [Gammaproteobacteria bacterium]|nr:hypothetical protein [Gammaproteobacteria bacterium]
MLTLSADVFAKRRQHVLAQLPEDAIAIIPSANDILRNGFDNTFFFSAKQ